MSDRRCAIVTGGASGIGRALAAELAAAGVHVVVADRDVAGAEEVASEIRSGGGAATAAELDVRDADRFGEVVHAAVAEHGRLDYLFNNAGIHISGEIRDLERADWDDVIDVNLRGVAHGILAAYPLMIEQGSGHIVNIASIAGLFPGSMEGSYTATKHAVVGLSRALRIEARRYGITVSVVCPGAVRTPLFQGGRYGRRKLGLEAAKLAAHFETGRPMAPSLFARRVLRAVDRGRSIIIEPRWWRLLWYIDRISPRLGERIGALVLQQMRRHLETDELRQRSAS